MAMFSRKWICTGGLQGSSMGQFFDQYLKPIRLNSVKVRKLLDCHMMFGAASLDVLKTRVEPWIWNQETLIVDIVKNLTYLFVSLFLKLLEFKSWSNKLRVGSFAWNLGWAVMFIKLLNVCLQIDWKSKDLTYMEEVCNLGLVITLADFELWVSIWCDAVFTISLQWNRR